MESEEWRVESGEWRVESGQRRLLGAGKRLLTQAHFLKDRAEINKTLNRSIAVFLEGLRRDRQIALRVDQTTLHSSLSTIHCLPIRAAVPCDGAADTE